MKRVRPSSIARLILLGCAATSCLAQSEVEPSRSDGSANEEVASIDQAFNPGCYAGECSGTAKPSDVKGHVEITKKAFQFLASRGLLPAQMSAASDQALVIYGDNFADHVWLGRPEAPSTSVPNRMTALTPAAGLTYSQTSGGFSFDVTVDNWFDSKLTANADFKVRWLPGNGADKPNTALRYQSKAHIFADTVAPFGLKDKTIDKNEEHAVDNLLHYTLGDLSDMGIAGLPADATRLKMYPFYPQHVADSAAQYAGWSAPEKDAANKLRDRLLNQPLLQGAEFGATKYGAILYQLARKFFGGSAAEPSLDELIKAGNTVPGWRTGYMQGVGELNEMYMPFPHTYLGGNPNVCSGSNSADPCAAGKPTWPVWVPEKAPTASNLIALDIVKPGRSNRAALIYLGWAAHMMQDASLPHHAANWTGKEHSAQDDFGDLPYFYNKTAGLESYWMDTFMANDLNTQFGTTAAPKTRAAICSSLGIADNQLVPGSLNWQAVRPVFVANAKAAYNTRAEVATAAQGAAYVKNAILGTMKLLLCATPSTGYWPTTGASGFVWSQQATGTFTASPSYSHNSSGLNVANTITQTGTGTYRVDFPGLGTETGGNVQVTAYGGTSERCKVGGWGSNGSQLSVSVNCHDAAGNPTNTLFSAAYVRRAAGNPAGYGGYLWADQPSAASYTPSLYYQWNSSGARNTIQRTGVGSYVANFPGLTFSGGTVEVTAYGSGSERCKVASWGGTSVGVNCYTAAGAPVDTYFTLNYVGGASPNGTMSYHYAWADQPSSASYTPSTWYQQGYLASECTTAGTMTMQRWSPGQYMATIPKLSPTGSNVQVTAYGGSGESCKVTGWGGSGDGGTNVSVACFDSAGQPVDSYFVIVYSTKDQIIC